MTINMPVFCYDFKFAMWNKYDAHLSTHLTYFGQHQIQLVSLNI